jgi:hypothetical protein
MPEQPWNSELGHEIIQHNDNTCLFEWGYLAEGLTSVANKQGIVE